MGGRERNGVNCVTAESAGFNTGSLFQGLERCKSTFQALR